MTQAEDLFLVKCREHPEGIEVPRDGLLTILGMAERGQLLGTLEVYSGERQVGSLRLAENGLWQLDSRSLDLSNEL